MEFLEEFDQIISLWADGDLNGAIYNSTNEHLFELAETLALSSRYHFKPTGKPNSNFSFVANSSLSGGRHPCAEATCRIKKLNELVSFASLYSDEVHIQNPFEEIFLSGPENLNEASRQEMMYGIYNYFYLRPLIESGIIKYAQNMVSLCSHHSETLAKPLSEKIERKEKKLYDLLEEQLIEKCSIYFDIKEDGTQTLKIEGPYGLIDHGVRYFHFYDSPPDFITRLSKKSLPYKFTKKEILDEGILGVIIFPIIKDLSNQEWHSAFYGTSYLCDNSTQINIASKLNNSAYLASSSAFNNAMNHTLPSVYGKDIRSIVDLRQKEGEAFSVYRDKVHKLLKTTDKWTESEVSEIFRDEIAPEINLIDKKIKDWKVKSKESLKEKLIFGSGAVSIGLYAGMLPPNIGAVVAAIGGGSAVVGAAMDYNKTLKEKTEARSNDFYFLWQTSK